MNMTDPLFEDDQESPETPPDAPRTATPHPWFLGALLVSVLLHLLLLTHAQWGEKKKKKPPEMNAMAV
ncbi:MAG: hypothetical protein HQL95_14730, partial [Magnetococcales bacterium]|nr:hypothetical protein [Magnetococcales bacterium]